MPRVSREQADTNRAAIEAVSACLFREQGLHGVSVADLMAAVGLTHGGFYGHFASKDVLAAVACQHAFDQAARRRARQLKKRVDDSSPLNTYAESYLSFHHRDQVGLGCPAVALAGDVAREPSDKPVRTAYLAGVKDMVEELESMSFQSDVGAQNPQHSQQHQQALLQLAALVGAVTIARATKGDAISDDILIAVREYFSNLFKV